METRQMETRKYLLLVALTKSTAVFGAGVLERLRAYVDPKANALWLDAGGAGIFVSTRLSAEQIWDCIVPEHLRVEHANVVKDMLVLELGSDHHGMEHSNALAWLRRHDTAAVSPEA
jgi:hypothetical protein